MENLVLTEINENLKIYQKSNGLTFGTDAYLLYAYMRKKISCKAADLGSGTGVISLLAASKHKFKEIYAYEIQEEFCEIIKMNTQINGLEDMVFPRCCDIRELKTAENGEMFDVVFTNPPYMKSKEGMANFEKCKNDARHEENGTIDDFCKSASSILKFGGYFYVVYRPDRLTDLIFSMRSNKLEPKIITFVYPREDMAPCLVLIEAKLGGGHSCIVSKPLIMCDKNGEYTPQLKYIYENGEFHEQYKKSR